MSSTVTATATTTTTSTSAAKSAELCSQCQCPLARSAFSALLKKGSRGRKVCPKERGGCGHSVCSPCLNHSLVTEEEAKKNGAWNSRLDTFCKTCFQRLSNLDYQSAENAVKIYDGDGKHATLLFVHGGAGCRLMFDPHARRLMAMGYRCVLLDLPGHGTNMDAPLTLESAIEYIVRVTEKYCPTSPHGQKPIYIGGSLGGYVGMELLGQRPDLFQAAVITMCGQHVGPGASFKARIALRLTSWMAPRMAPRTFLGAMRAQAKRNGHISDDLLLDTFLRPGIFFGQGRELVAILQNSKPHESLPKFQGSVLFINGSRDHRDSEQIWQEKSKRGQLIVYEGADHFSRMTIVTWTDSSTT